MTATRYMPKQLTVFFDSDCAFCIRCAEWLGEEPCFVPVELVPMHSAVVAERFPSIAAEIEKGKFVVADDRGGVYFDSAARLMCLYATKRYRALSLTLSRPALRPLVDRFFQAIGANRYRISRLFAPRHLYCSGGGCDE